VGLTAFIRGFNVVLLLGILLASDLHAGAATEIRTKAGQGQVAPEFTTLPQSPSVIVLDGGGNPVSGVQVTFAVETGGGSITGAVQMSGADGVATVGSWTLGAAGMNTISATSPGLTNSPLTLFATAAGPPVAFEIFAGNNQVALVSRFVTSPCAIVKDALGTGVPGVAVNFNVVGDGGVATGLAQTTNSQGIAIVGSWQLGSTPGVQQLEALCPVLPDKRVVFDAFADPDPPTLSGPLVRPLAPLAGETVTFSSPTDLQNPQYTWDFGDGTVLLSAPGTVTHVYPAPGAYQVAVQAANIRHSVDGALRLVVYRSGSLSITRKSLRAQTPSLTKDSLSVSGTITLPSGLTQAPTQVVVRFGGMTRSFDLSKGVRRTDGQSFKLSAKVKDGVVETEAKFSFKLIGNLAKELAAAGLPAGQSGSVSIPLQIVLADANAAANATATFSIKGTAKTQSGK